MKTKIRKIGNSSGVILSKKMLEDLNIEPKDELQLSVKDGKIIIQKLTEHRENWAEQFMKADSLNDKSLEMTFANEFDEEEWTW